MPKIILYQGKPNMFVTSIEWIGEFYAYYHRYYNIPSSEFVKKVVEM